MDKRVCNECKQTIDGQAICAHWDDGGDYHGHYWFHPKCVLRAYPWLLQDFDRYYMKGKPAFLRMYPRGHARRDFLTMLSGRSPLVRQSLGFKSYG